MQQNNSTQKVVAGSITALLVAVLVTAISFYETSHRSSSAASNTTVPSSTSSAGSTSGSTSSGSTMPMSSSSSGSGMMSSYKDGTYSASSSYYVPHGQESIQVTLTLKNGVVTDSSVTNSETNYESASYQEGFAQEYKSYVIGKNIKDVQLSYVAGASDTTNGFNDAVNSIMSQAQS